MPEIQCVHMYVCVSKGQAPGQAEEPRPTLCCILCTYRTVCSRPAAVGCIDSVRVWGKRVFVSGSVPESRDGMGLRGLHTQT